MKQTWGLEREFEWQMGHALVDYEGPCTRVHGHSWKAAVSVDFTELNKARMGVDFSELKKVEKFVNDHWDHQTLLPYNHLALQPYIQGEEEWDPIIKELGFVPVPFNPTCEQLSMYLAVVTSELMGVDLSRVTVSVRETSKNSCIYMAQPSLEMSYEFQSKLEELETFLRYSGGFNNGI